MKIEIKLKWKISSRIKKLKLQSTNQFSGQINFITSSNLFYFPTVDYDEKVVVNLASRAKKRLQEMFQKRFTQTTRKTLRLSMIFDPTATVPNVLKDDLVESLIARYKNSITKTKILMKAEFAMFFRSMEKVKSKSELERTVEKKLQHNSSLCETVLQIKSKIRAIWGMTVDSERVFH